MKKVLLSVALSVAATHAFAATASTAPTADSSTEAATISATVGTLAPKPSKIGLTYVAESTVSSRAAHLGNWDGAADSYQHVGVAYKLSNDVSLQFRQYFYYNLSEANALETDEWSIGEHVFVATNKKFLNVGGADIMGQVRLYVPGSEYMRDIGQYEIRFNNEIEQALGKLTMSYGLSNRFYAYTESSDGQMGYRVLPSVAAKYKVNEIVSPFVTAFTEHRFYHNGVGISALGPNAGRLNTFDSKASNTDKVFTDIGASFTINKNISLDFYMETGKDLRKGTEYSLFDEKSSIYELDLVVAL